MEKGIEIEIEIGVTFSFSIMSYLCNQKVRLTFLKVFFE
jgi:hypothetical protein